jgi:hypothetical protein
MRFESRYIFHGAILLFSKRFKYVSEMDFLGLSQLTLFAAAHQTMLNRTGMGKPA